MVDRGVVHLSLSLLSRPEAKTPLLSIGSWSSSIFIWKFRKSVALGLLGMLMRLMGLSDLGKCFVAFYTASDIPGTYHFCRASIMILSKVPVSDDWS